VSRCSADQRRRSTLGAPIVFDSGFPEITGFTGRQGNWVFPEKAFLKRIETREYLQWAEQVWRVQSLISIEGVIS
jgi:hypothetical protein